MDVVTGGASRIGAAIVRRLLAEGAQVVAADINAEPLQQMERAARGKLASVVADVTKEDANEEMMAKAVERFGGLHVAFNVAGAAFDTARGGPIVDLAEADWDWTVDLILKDGDDEVLVRVRAS